MRYRRGIVVAAGIVAVLAIAVAVMYRTSDRTRWLLVRYYYYVRVAVLPAEAGKPKKAFFSWTDGLESDVSLEYDEGDTDAPAPGETVKSWQTERCLHSVTRLEGHFYLNAISC